MTATRTYGVRIHREQWAGSQSVAVRVLVRENENASPINPRSEGENSIGLWEIARNGRGEHENAALSVAEVDGLCDRLNVQGLPK